MKSKKIKKKKRVEIIFCIKSKKKTKKKWKNRQKQNMPVKKTVKKTKFFEKDKTLRWIIFDNRLKKLKEKKTILLYLFNCNHKTTAFAQKQIFVL